MFKELLLVRHAIAQDRNDFKKTGQPDDLRPLTTKGVKKMLRIAQWLAHASDSPYDFIAESPRLRSQQTADILIKKIKSKERIRLKELGPEYSPEEICQILDKKEWSRGLLVGHEPHLSHLICFLTGISAKHYSEFEMKKGGIASFKLTNPLMSRTAQLQWVVTPKIVLSFYKKKSR